MISGIPSNDESMTIFELMTNICADRAVNTYRPDQSAEWETANHNLHEYIETLPIDFDSKNKLHNSAVDFESIVINQMYKHGFSDGISFIIEALGLGNEGKTLGFKQNYVKTKRNIKKPRKKPA